MTKCFRVCWCNWIEDTIYRRSYMLAMSAQLKFVRPFVREFCNWGWHVWLPTWAPHMSWLRGLPFLLEIKRFQFKANVECFMLTRSLRTASRHFPQYQNLNWLKHQYSILYTRLEWSNVQRWEIWELYSHIPADKQPLAPQHCTSHCQLKWKNKLDSWCNLVYQHEFSHRCRSIGPLNSTLLPHPPLVAWFNASCHKKWSLSLISLIDFTS